jgi:hypothetical protein
VQLTEVEQLEGDTNDVDRVIAMMTRDPTLHRAPLGYSAAGELVPGTALDYLIGSYARSAERLSRCIDILLAAGAETKYDHPAVLALLRGRLDHLAQVLAADPGLTEQRFAELDCGMTGGRRLTLEGGTLLHVAAEYGNAEQSRCCSTGASMSTQGPP